MSDFIGKIGNQVSKMSSVSDQLLAIEQRLAEDLLKVILK